MITFTITGETPAKKNSRINLKNGRSIPSKKYQEWHFQAQTQLLNQIALLPQTLNPISKPCKVSIYFTHGDLRRRDSDNGCSSIMDLLVDCHVLFDDRWNIVKEIHVYNDFDKGNPHCKITIDYIDSMSVMDLPDKE